MHNYITLHHIDIYMHTTLHTLYHIDIHANDTPYINVPHRYVYMHTTQHAESIDVWIFDRHTYRYMYMHRCRGDGR